MLRSALVSLSLLALAPAGASAATYCAPAPCGDDPARAFATPQEAVDAADATLTADVVEIGAGTFDVGPDGLRVSDEGTAVRGAGRDATILTTEPMPAGAGWGQTVVSGYMSGLTDLTVRLASAVTSGNSTMQGIDVYDGVVERVRVDAEGAIFGPGSNDGQAQGILLRRGTLRDVEVAFDPAADASGVRIGHIGGSAALDGVSVVAREGVYSAPEVASPGGPPSPVTAQRLQVRSARPLSVGDGSFTLSDALLVALPDADTAGDEESAAVSLYAGRSPNPAALTLDRVTIAGGPGAISTALAIGGGAGPTPTRLTARHLIVSGFMRTLVQNSWGGDLETTISWSAADTSAGAVVDATDPSSTARRTLDVATGNRSGAVAFASWSGVAPFTPLTSSPANDVGGAWLIPAGERDLAGVSRDAAEPEAAHDAGANLPVVPLPGPIPGPPECACAPPGGPGGPGGPGEGPGRGRPRPGQDRVKPLVSRLALVTRRPRRGAPARPVAVRFRLSEAATVRLTLQRRVPARRARGGRRIAARWVAAGRPATARLRAGATTLSIRGGTKLAAGRYRVTLVATDAAGNTSRAGRIGFSVAAGR